MIGEVISIKKVPFLKIIYLLIIGIILFFVIEAIIGEVVSAKIKGQEKGDDEVFPFYWLLVIVGGIIASTLTYVSWRKYIGEKNNNQSKDNDITID